MSAQIRYRGAKVTVGGEVFRAIAAECEVRFEDQPAHSWCRIGPVGIMRATEVSPPILVFSLTEFKRLTDAVFLLEMHPRYLVEIDGGPTYREALAVAANIGERSITFESDCVTLPGSSEVFGTGVNGPRYYNTGLIK